MSIPISGYGQTDMETLPASPQRTLRLDFIGPDPTNSAGSSVYVSEGDQHKDEFTQTEGDAITPQPMIPPNIKLKENAKRRLINYLVNEIQICREERRDQIDMFARLKLKYRTKFPEIPKDWPIANSSQLVVPVIKTAVNTLSARIYQTLMAAEPPASIRTEDMEYQDISNDLEKFLKIYSEERIGYDKVFDSLVTETIKLGTGVLEVCSEVNKRKVVYWDGADYVASLQDSGSGPTFRHVPIEDFWMRPAYQDVQEAPWCGKLVRFSWSQIKDMAVNGQLDPEAINNIWRFPFTKGDMPATTTTEEEIERVKPRDYDQFGLFWLAVRWDVDGDGVDEELIVWFEEFSRTILRITYNQFNHCRRPWIVFRLFLIEHRLYGEGLAEMLEHLQEEISTIHNQRIDNATVANLQIILVRRLIQGLRPGERLWSGKIVRVQDVHDDVGTLRLGEIYPSTVANENISQTYVREVSGLGEAALGTAQPVSRTTAAAQLAMLEELNRRFDKILRGMRGAIRDSYVQLIDLFAQQGTDGLAEVWLGQERGARLNQFLGMPGPFIERKIKVQVLSTKASVNREVEFQSSIAVMNLIVQHGEQLLSLSQSLAPQVIGQVAHELLAVIRPVFKKVMQYADAPSADQAMRVLDVLERALPAPEVLGGVGPGQAPGAPIPPEILPPAAGGGAGEGAGPEGPGGAQMVNRLARLETLVNALGRTNGRSGGLVSRGQFAR